MGRRSDDTGINVRRVDVLRGKFSRELAVEAAWLSDMPAFDASPRPYALSFYDILLVTEGQGTFALDGVVHPVAPGVVFFTRPGEVRRWQVSGLQGACVFFTADFVREAFADAHFIDQFAFFRPNRPAGALTLDPAQRARFEERFTEMRREFAGLRGDAPDLLRAKLYELLVLLNRWYADGLGQPPATALDTAVERFAALIERDFAKRRTLEDYAGELGVSPGHLSVLCRQRLGCTAAALIRRRAMVEAKRLLLFTDMPASAVAYALGFEDAAYFSRFFRRETGVAPRRFRLDRGAAAGRGGGLSPRNHSRD